MATNQLEKSDRCLFKMAHAYQFATVFTQPICPFGFLAPVLIPEDFSFQSEYKTDLYALSCLG